MRRDLRMRSIILDMTERPRTGNMLLIALNTTIFIVVINVRFVIYARLTFSASLDGVIKKVESQISECCPK